MTVAVVAAAVAAVAVGVAVAALLGQRRVQRAYRVFRGGSREDVLGLIERHIDEVEALRGEAATLRRRTEELRGLLAGCVSRVATLRYDAFDDMGGHLSYSTALLDEHGDGVVLTSIHGRTDTRTYAKPIQRGESRHTLSGEEHAVIQQALDQSRAAAPTPPATATAETQADGAAPAASPDGAAGPRRPAPKRGRRPARSRPRRSP